MPTLTRICLRGHAGHRKERLCGYKLANDGIDIRAIQDWLGHVSITHTTRYTALS
jgi:site-specific recombinase XerC